ncbi:MAG: hypothetical protein HUK17_05015 [Bacteroidales bacterium]|nr:hypothetical protein [Bacteroidales bacterium]
MKKVLFLLSMMAAVCAWAQGPELTFGKTAKGFDYNTMDNATIVAHTSEGTLAVVPCSHGAMAGNVLNGDLWLRLINMNGDIVRELHLPNTEEHKIPVFGGIKFQPTAEYFGVIANYVDGKAYILYRSEVGFARIVVNPTTMQIESTTEMKYIDLAEEQCTIHTAVSPNKDYAVLSVVNLNAPNHLMLLNRTLEVQWHNNAYAEECFVDNQGQVYTCSSDLNRYGATEMKLVLYTPDGQETEEHPVINMPMAVKFLNATDGVVVALGLVPSNEQSPKEPNVTFDRIAGIAFDFSTKTPLFTMEPITSDEFNVFGNLPTKKTNKVGKVDGIKLSTSLATSFGGVCMVERRWRVVVRDANTGMVNKINYATSGTMMVAVDKKGNILWHLPFRINKLEGVGPNILASAKLMERDGYIYMLRMDSGAPATYDISKPAPKYNPAMNFKQYGLYRINAHGQVEKTVFKGKGALVGQPFQYSDNGYVILQGVLKGGIATLTF